MKKLILLLTILISTISINAKTFYYRTSAIAIDNLDGYGYGEWKPCELDITIDFDLNQIVIYSSEIQIMDIDKYNIIEYKDYSVIICQTNDTEYNNCLLKLFIYKNGNLYVKLEYLNIVYKYKTKQYNN